jgi:hypothetical protein
MELCEKLENLLGDGYMQNRHDGISRYTVRIIGVGDIVFIWYRTLQCLVTLAAGRVLIALERNKWVSLSFFRSSLNQNQENRTHAMTGGLASDPKACQANTPAPFLPCEVESRVLATTSSESDGFRAQRLRRHSRYASIPESQQADFNAQSRSTYDETEVGLDNWGTPGTPNASGEGRHRISSVQNLLMSTRVVVHYDVVK